MRILICTDAAREGINLQMRCHDLIHVDLPWNPARLEQRNRRIDRKLQRSPKVWCRYFVYEQSEEDVVLQALVRKTELIRTQLGSAGQVIAHRLTGQLEREGVTRPQSLAHEIAATDDEVLRTTAVTEMDDATEVRRSRQAKEIDDLRDILERSREQVGVDPDEPKSVFATALSRAGTSLDATRDGHRPCRAAAPPAHRHACQSPRRSGKPQPAAGSPTYRSRPHETEGHAHPAQRRLPKPSNQSAARSRRSARLMMCLMSRRIEAAFKRLTDYRRIATRYDRLARNYLVSAYLATALP